MSCKLSGFRLYLVYGGLQGPISVLLLPALEASEPKVVSLFPDVIIMLDRVLNLLAVFWRLFTVLGSLFIVSDDSANANIQVDQLSHYHFDSGISRILIFP